MSEPIYYSINEGAAKTAKRMNSFYEYRQGSETADYRSEVDEAYKLADWAAERNPERADEAYRLADSYAQKLAEWVNHGFSIESRYPSILIAGGSNFDVKKKNKQNAARDSHMEKYEAINGMLDKIRRIGTGANIIKSSDANAADKLQAKIAKLEEAQDAMKKANAYYRKHGTLEGCEQLNEKERESAMQTLELYPRLRAPFPPYSLQNNLANIKSAKKRLEGIEAAKERGTNSRTVTIEGKEVKVTENTEAMRIQFLFPSKPSEEVRTVLKQHGFRWSGKYQAWQRQITGNARYATMDVIKKLTA